MTIRTFLARVLNVWVWRTPKRTAAKYRAFSLAEESSKLDLLAAANHTKSPERAAMYLRHASDESRHAQMFHRRANQWANDAGQTPFPAPRADTEALFASLGETRFVAFVHLGEQRGREQFETYAAYFQSQHQNQHRNQEKRRDQGVFEAVLRDERHHEAYTKQLLPTLTSHPERVLRRVRLWEAYRTFRRVGRAMTQVVFVGLMVLLYLLAAPMALVTRFAASGWRAVAVAGSEIDAEKEKGA